MAAPAEAAQQFLVISDIHFNPLANAELTPKLMAADASLWEGIFASASAAPVQKYGEDSGWPLLESLFSGVQNISPRPKLIVVTGDVLPHKFLDKYAAASHNTDAAGFHTLVKKTFAFISLELEKAAGGVPVVYTLGNNDVECGDYALQPNGPFLQDAKRDVQRLAQVDAGAMDQWDSVGSYVKSNPLAAHRRIIALNSNFWSRRYVNACGEKASQSADPGDAELKWLGDQLKDAQQNGDEVWLVYHIPPGIDGHSSSLAKQVLPMWKPKYAGGFDHLLDEYRKIVELNLAGHTHLDDIRLVKTEHTDTLVLINPAVSPNIGQNPAFRVISVDAQARPVDIATYYIPDLSKLKWQLEYSSRSVYDLKKIDARSYEALDHEIEQSPAAFDRWKNYYSVSRPASLKDDKGYLRSLYCAMGNAAADAFQSCLNSGAK